MSGTEIDIFKCLDFIRDHAPEYAQAKADRIYMEEYRKSLKASYMSEMVGEPVNAQERYAYAHPGYVAHLKALSAAVEKEENLRWLLIGVQAKISVWQSLGANQRAEAKVL